MSRLVEYSYPRFGNRSRDLSKLKDYTVLEIAPLNKPVGINGYSPIETILTSVAKGLPRIQGRNLSSYVLCARGSKNSSVYTSIETVDAIGNWHGSNDNFFWDRYKKHFNEIFGILDQIDVIHNHTVEFPQFLSQRRLRMPVINTVHISHRESGLKYLVNEGGYYVAISKSHKRDLEKNGIAVSRVVYNGVDVKSIPFDTKKEDYVLSIGRITRDKGQDIAIKSARNINQKIVVAGPVQGKKEDKEYFEREIQPFIELRLDFERNPEENMRRIIEAKEKVIYCSEIGESKKHLYKRAKALMFPIQWEEPFGLVMVEALAAGTPVLAYRRGSVPEIIEHGKNGFIFDNIDDLTEGIKHVSKIDPMNCRKTSFNFSNEKMVENYSDLFDRILKDFRLY